MNKYFAKIIIGIGLISLISCNNKETVSKKIEWSFPSTFCHDGMPLGNGNFGTLVWGKTDSLYFTINRQDYWDHRGGIKFNSEANYENLSKWLLAGNETKLRKVFEGEKMGNDTIPRRPSRMPMGRFLLILNDNIESGYLNITKASANIKSQNEISAFVDRNKNILFIKISGEGHENVKLIPEPAYNFENVKKYFDKYKIPQPILETEKTSGHWIQKMPNDPTLIVKWSKESKKNATYIIISSVFENEEDVDLKSMNFEESKQINNQWWNDFWQNSTSISLPEKEIQKIYDLGIYKLASATAVNAPAITLQGPWVEAYKMPPWSSDYHFNINVQECYWPALPSNNPQLMQPLIKMLYSWFPVLEENAKSFIGIDDGMMLPHAVDDRGKAMGGFWPGFIDHGSTAWMCQIFYDYYLHTQSKDFLSDTLYPLMKGTMNVYEQMLEKEDDNWALPIGVSPEIGGSSMNAWGKNSSFQLAVIHWLLEALITSVDELNINEEKFDLWVDIKNGLPLCSIEKGEKEYQKIAWDGKIYKTVLQKQINLFEDRPPLSSHRHHSHIAGLYPFDIFDLDNPEQKKLVKNTMKQLVENGYSWWTGWSMPWASILWSRMDNGEGAALMLDAYQRMYTTRGNASTHDALHDGFSLMRNRDEVMQLEASLASSAAVLEMLVHTQNGITKVFPALPTKWTNVSFEGISIPGGALLSAELYNGKLARLSIYFKNEADIILKLPEGNYPKLEAFKTAKGNYKVRGAKEEKLIMIK
jgi:hypothetical protein